MLEICFEGGLKVNNDLKKNVVYDSSSTYYDIKQNMRGLVGATCTDVPHGSSALLSSTRQ